MTEYNEAWYSLCQDVKALRKDLGMTQTELADRLGLTHSVISKLERGNNSNGPLLFNVLGVLLPMISQQSDTIKRADPCLYERVERLCAWVCFTEDSDEQD